MERTIKGKHLSETYWSVSDYADTSDSRASKVRTRDQKRYFTDLPGHAESVHMLRTGWAEELPGAMAIAESAVSLAEQEHMVDSFSHPVWDVTGAQVDIGAFLAGTPECMIDYPLTETSRVGRVVTLVVPICFSSWVETESVLRRGHVIMALALALNRLGHACEIWADINLRGSATVYQRICLKAVDGELDPAVLMFTLAHAAMLRRVAFGTWDGFPDRWREEYSDNATRGRVGHRTKDDVALYPEGTIFLPELTDESDYADADKFLRKYLGELGLLAE